MQVLESSQTDTPQDILPEDFKDFFAQFPRVFYKKRDIIQNADDFSTSVFYIKSGYIRVYRVSEQGEELTLAILKQHDLFPIAWGASEISSGTYLEAITSVEIWRVPRGQFMEFIESHPAVFYRLITLMSMRLGGLFARIEYLVTGHAYTKVAATVLACARRFGERRGNDVVVGLPLTHRDIATLVGITRETTCLEMKKLEKKGLIAHKNRLLVVKDMEKLEQESSIDNGAGGLLYNSL